MPDMSYRDMLRKRAFTPRQKRLLKELENGHRIRYIAERFKVSEGGIRAAAHRLYKMIGVKNRRELTEWMLDSRFPELESLRHLRDAVAVYLDPTHVDYRQAEIDLQKAYERTKTTADIRPIVTSLPQCKGSAGEKSTCNTP